MFFHNFKYTLKTLFKNKMLIFWTFAFPIILGTFFQMAFSNIENSEKLNIIPIAIVENNVWKENPIYQKIFQSLSEEGSEEQLFKITYGNEEEIKTLLDDGTISGYILFEDSPKIIVKENGINQTVLKYATEEIIQTQTIIQNRVLKEMTSIDVTVEGSIEALYEKVSKQVMLQKGEDYLQDHSSIHLSYTMIEFYTLIAMTCLYGGIIGMTAVNQNLANMSHNGKRVAVSPTSKGQLIFSSVLASYIIQLIGVALLFFYTKCILHVNYGENYLLVILLTLVGCLAGLSLGIMIASVFKTSENMKTGIVLAVTMFGSFLSGMMGITMKYLIDKNVPIINQLNPASMITDGFYSLYYYDTLNRYYFNVISLLIFSFVMIAISIFSLRRQKYDSI